MKKYLIIATVAFVITNQCNNVDSNLDFENKIKTFYNQTSVKRIHFRQLELRKVSEECYQNNNEDACARIQLVKDAIKQDYLLHAKDPCSLITTVLLRGYYTNSQLDRKERYAEDNDILGFYKDRMSQELYDFFRAVEKAHDNEREEWLASKHTFYFVKDVNDPNNLNYYSNQLMQKLKEIQAADEDLYGVVLNYLIESASAKNSNTKTPFFKNREQIVNAIEKFKEEDEKNAQKLMLYIDAIPDYFFNASTMSLEEIKKAIAENSEL